jgi:hypothetical protein
MGKEMSEKTLVFNQKGECSPAFEIANTASPSGQNVKLVMLNNCNRLIPGGSRVLPQGFYRSYNTKLPHSQRNLDRAADTVTVMYQEGEILRESCKK